MAVLSDPDRAALFADLMREALGDMGVTKPQLRAVVDALDDFFTTNASAINSAIPTPQRTLLTTPQKARIAAAVLLKRYDKGA